MDKLIRMICADQETIWTWSVRPDLWPAGQHLRVYSVWPGRSAWAWYAYSQRSAQLDLQRAERDGAPGVAEAAILAGVVEAAILADGVATRSW